MLAEYMLIGAARKLAPECARINPRRWFARRRAANG